MKPQNIIFFYVLNPNKLYLWGKENREKAIENRE